MKHIYFVRHGLSEMNKAGIFSGRTDTPLAPEGVAQAHAAGKSCKGLGIDLIISSPMERARETAHIIAAEIGYPIGEVLIEDIFMEREFGMLEGQPYVPDMEMDHINGVETGEELVDRARSGLEFLKSLSGESILIVSHGSMGRALRHVIDPAIPFTGADKFKNAQVTKLL